MFSNLKRQPSDPIMGVNEEFKKCKSPEKYNLSIGVYADDEGQLKTFDTVKEAEHEMLNENISKTYLPILGSPLFRDSVKNWVLGNDSEDVFCCYSPGGTGVIRLLGELLSLSGYKRVWVGSPTWGNHIGIFNNIGIEIIQYPHLDQEGNLNYEYLTERLEKELRQDDILLLHACCHNPTGVDPNHYQWEGLTDICKSKNAMLFLDFAYHGFAHSSFEDLAPVRKAFDKLDNIVLSYSFSKIMGLYCERVGAGLIKTKGGDELDILSGNVSSLIRQSISNPPAHGLRVAERILSSPSKVETWQKELLECADRVRMIRKRLAQEFGSIHPYFADFESKHGMFGMFPFTKEQVLKLRAEKNIYFLENGRVNLCGFNSSNMSFLMESFGSVLKGN